MSLYYSHNKIKPNFESQENACCLRPALNFTFNEVFEFGTNKVENVPRFNLFFVQILRQENTLVVVCITLYFVENVHLPDICPIQYTYRYTHSEEKRKGARSQHKKCAREEKRMFIFYR